MSSNPAKVPKKKIGPKIIKSEGPMPRLYFVYYYETKDGDSGMSNVVLSNMTTIKTMQDLVNVIAYIKGQESDPEKFTKIEPINWMPLEG